MDRLIRRAVAVWWFIKGLSLSILIYVTPFYYFSSSKPLLLSFPSDVATRGIVSLARCDGTSLWTVFPSLYSCCMGKSSDCFVYIVCIVVILYIDFIVFLLLILSGDVELNPGPVNGRNRQCRVLYSNIRGLHGNLHDLIVASKVFIFYCVLKLWFQILGTLQNFLFQVSKGQYYLNVMKSIEPTGWQYTLGVVVLPLIRPALNVGVMKLKSSKCVANIIISIWSLFIGILMLMMGFFIVF